MSQLLLRLEKEISSASDPMVRAELLARMSCGLARLGRFDEALEIVRQLRATHNTWNSVRVHVWIMLAEGLTHWYQSLSPLALDRITRAQVLSLATRYSTVIALASAWKAHIEFEMSNFDAMFRSLKLARDHLGPDDHDSSARVSIVLCNSFALCGDLVNTQTWFKAARQSALREGDQAGIEALQYNRAALTITWIRASRCVERISTEDLERVRREFNSARNLQSLTQIGTFVNHLQLCEARLLMMEGQFERAMAIIPLARGESPTSPHHFNAHLLELEASYCLFRLGRVDEALMRCSKVDFASFIESSIDDRLVVETMRCEMSESDPRFGDTDSIAKRQSELANAFGASMTALRGGLQDFKENSGQT